MKIVIFGIAKSGTTALFYKIKNSLAPNTLTLFEPQSFDPLAVKNKGIKSLVRRHEPGVLAKVLPCRPHHPVDVESFLNFDKQILLVRDPRDRLISRFYYGVYHSDFCQHDDKVRAFLKVLAQKESNPRSVSLQTLLATWAELNGERFSFSDWIAALEQNYIHKPLEFHDRHGNLFLFHYEDMIDRRFEGLEKYLALPLNGNDAVDPELRRVARTMSYGGWRDWFTPEDIQHLRPVMEPFLDRYYEEADWRLNESPSIPPEHSSLYIEQIVNDRRFSLKLPAFASYSSGI